MLRAEQHALPVSRRAVRACRARRAAAPGPARPAHATTGTACVSWQPWAWLLTLHNGAMVVAARRLRDTSGSSSSLSRCVTRAKSRTAYRNCADERMRPHLRSAHGTGLTDRAAGATRFPLSHLGSSSWSSRMRPGLGVPALRGCVKCKPGCRALGAYRVQRRSHCRRRVGPSLRGPVDERRLGLRDGRGCDRRRDRGDAPRATPRAGGKLLRGRGPCGGGVRRHGHRLRAAVGVRRFSGL